MVKKLSYLIKYTDYLYEDFLWILSDLNIDIEYFDSFQEIWLENTSTILSAFCEKLNQYT